MYKRLLKVALIGAPNAGKSTLLNRLVESEVSCVSKKVHTTRKNVLAYYTKDDAQIEFYDSPGIVTRKHLIKHRMEDSLLNDPVIATNKCDLIAVMVDVSNIREQRRLNKGVLNLLSQNKDKESILIMNKVDMVKDKRSLLDIGTRLTQGCIDGHLTFNPTELKHLSPKRLIELNLTKHIEPILETRRQVNEKNRKPLEENSDHATPQRTQTKTEAKSRTRHKYVIELEPKTLSRETNNLNASESIYSGDQIEEPDLIGYKNFSQVFSISALHDDGVDELRDHLLSRATPVEEWPRGPELLTDQNCKEIVHEIIRGKVLDYVENEVPYLLKYKYLSCGYDEFGSLHVHLLLKCPSRYMVPKVVGENGSIVSKINYESKKIISNVLACDVSLSIAVEVAAEKKAHPSKVKQ